MNHKLDSTLVEWVSSCVLPFEAELRGKLSRICRNGAEVDDVVQEVYCRLYNLDSIAQIHEPRGYVMRMAKNIVIDQLRRETVVDIEAVANLDALDIEDPSPTPERVALARAELRWVMGLIANLPERCKQVFRARRVYGLSIDATSEALGLSEHVIEKELTRGLALLSESIARVGVDAGAAPAPAKGGKAASRRKHV